ncbi:MAG: hypothetical protein B6D79_15300, partial [gamma proteobacterium symbiont of Ctena orbiculata]
MVVFEYHCVFYDLQDPVMLILRGAPALSEFRLKKLALRLSSLCNGKVGIVSEYLHFADINQSLDETERAVLENLLR